MPDIEDYLYNLELGHHKFENYCTWWIQIQPAACWLHSYYSEYCPSATESALWLTKFMLKEETGVFWESMADVLSLSVISIWI